MTRTALLLPIALLGLSGTAFAGIDDVAASMLDGEEELVQIDDVQDRTTRTQTRSNGKRSVTRQSTSARGGRTQGQRVTYSNGRSSHTKARGRSTSGGRTTTYKGTRTTHRGTTTSRSVTSTSRATGRPNAIPARGTTSSRPASRPSASRPSTSSRPSASRPRTSSRPSVASRPRTASRPSTRTHVVHHRSRPATRSVVHRRTVHYTSVRPYHGVFVYGPAPVHHHHYVDSGPAEVRQTHMPDRAVDRANSLAVGLKMGSLTSGYDNGSIYGDLGVGLAGRYRPAESVGLQLDLTHHAQSWSVETERAQTVAAGSVQLFAFPWTRVSPYAIGGVTYDARNIQDQIGSGAPSATVIANDSLWGLHGGVGVELAMGKSVALDLEGRYIGYIDKSPTDPSLPGAFQFTGGLMVHF